MNSVNPHGSAMLVHIVSLIDHAIFERDSLGGNIIRINGRNEAMSVKVLKSIVFAGSRCLCCESLIPVCSDKRIGNFDLGLSSHIGLMKKTT